MLGAAIQMAVLLSSIHFPFIQSLTNLCTYKYHTLSHIVELFSQLPIKQYRVNLKPLSPSHRYIYSTTLKVRLYTLFGKNLQGEKAIHNILFKWFLALEWLDLLIWIVDICWLLNKELLVCEQKVHKSLDPKQDMFSQKYLKKQSPAPLHVASSGTISEILESGSTIRRNSH